MHLLHPPCGPYTNEVGGEFAKNHLCLFEELHYPPPFLVKTPTREADGVIGKLVFYGFWVSLER